jgi:two-component sensor histidine kinase/ActR/RegA family two-component response regulator
VDDPAGYAAAVEGRVHALTRAHDLLARDRWAGASLGEVAAQELAAQIANGQATMEGPSVTLVPKAVQPISMVLHELVTNAAKYGALSVPEGHVRVSWDFRPGEGPLNIEWTEKGGPPVAEPATNGFGTRLIQATVTGQLEGSVRCDWAREGLRCAISLPPRCVGGFAGAGAAVASSAEPEETHAALAGARVLVVEDEALIAAELVMSLTRAGGRPLGPYATIETADAAASGGAVDAAVLDINLDRSDSLPLARALLAKGVPVVVVTGYGILPRPWANQKGLSAIWRKPVDPGRLVAAVGRALQRERAA